MRYWQAWSEPNRDYFLMPQYAGGQIASATHYRAMVRRFAAGVHAVSPANRVVAGGLAPLGRTGKPSPLAFMRSMLCLSKTLGRACDLRSNPVPIDVWSHHPYTSGGPTHRAAGKDDVALGDLPDMRRVLNAAKRLGHVRSTGRARLLGDRVQLGHEAAGPEGAPVGAPRALDGGGALPDVAERRLGRHLVPRHGRPALDELLPVRPLHGRGRAQEVPERLPLPRRRADALERRVRLGAERPFGARGKVRFELNSGRGWRPLASVTAGSTGIVSRTFRTPVRRGHVRARFAGETSVPFSLTYARDRFVNPFGCGGSIPC